MTFAKMTNRRGFLSWLSGILALPAAIIALRRRPADWPRWPHWKMVSPKDNDPYIRKMGLGKEWTHACYGVHPSDPDKVHCIVWEGSRMSMSGWTSIAAMKKYGFTYPYDYDVYKRTGSLPWLSYQDFWRQM